MSATTGFIFGLLLPSVIIFSVIYLVSLRMERGLKAVSLYLLIVGAYLLSKNVSNALTFFITGTLTILASFSFRVSKRKSKLLAILLSLLLLTFPIYVYLSLTPLNITYSIKILQPSSHNNTLMKNNIVDINYTIINHSPLPVKAPYLYVCSPSGVLLSFPTKKEKIIWKSLKEEIKSGYYYGDNKNIDVCFTYKNKNICKECIKAERVEKS